MRIALPMSRTTSSISSEIMSSTMLACGFEGFAMDAVSKEPRFAFRTFRSDPADRTCGFAFGVKTGFDPLPDTKSPSKVTGREDGFTLLTDIFCFPCLLKLAVPKKRCFFLKRLRPYRHGESKVAESLAYIENACSSCARYKPLPRGAGCASSSRI